MGGANGLPVAGMLEQAMRLSFNNFLSLHSTGPTPQNKAGLESAYQQYRARQALNVDRAIAIGVAFTHLLATLALSRSCFRTLAILPLTTAFQQGVTAFLVAHKPATYAKWRPTLYVFNIIWGMVEGTIIPSYLQFNVCSQSSFFWVSQCIINSFVPWLILHGLVFPLPLPTAFVVHGMVTVATTLTNSSRCSRSLKSCAAGSLRFQTVYNWFGRSFGLFSATMEPPSQPQLQALPSCVSINIAMQVFAFAALMHLLWINEHASRLAFLAKTDHVDIEWELERMRKPRVPDTISRVLELGATFLFLAYLAHAVAPEVVLWKAAG